MKTGEDGAGGGGHSDGTPHRALAFATALNLSEVRAAQSDSLLRVAVRSGEAGENRRWLVVLPCMSRRTVLLDVAAAVIPRKFM